MLKLKEFRIEKNLTQEQMAEVLNVTRSTYSVWEIEINTIPIKHLIRLCNYFNISLDYIFGFSDNKKYKNMRDNIDNLLVGERLRQFRKNNKLTQVKLASILNTTQSVIAGYEIGRRLIATPFLYEICNRYKVSADYLMSRIDTPIYIKELVYV